MAEAPLRVIGQSSGNHAQGLSWAASKCGFIAEIVMPDNTHQHKIKVVKDYGGRVHLGPCVQVSSYILSSCFRCRLIGKERVLTGVHKWK